MTVPATFLKKTEQKRKLKEEKKTIFFFGSVFREKTKTLFFFAGHCMATTLIYESTWWQVNRVIIDADLKTGFKLQRTCSPENKLATYHERHLEKVSNFLRVLHTKVLSNSVRLHYI